MFKFDRHPAVVYRLVFLPGQYIQRLLQDTGKDRPVAADRHRLAVGILGVAGDTHIVECELAGGTRRTKLPQLIAR